MYLRLACAAALAAFGLSLSACSSSRPDTRVVVTAESSPRHGPPPHAPAHGYRHKHKDGMDLVYDAPHGVYLVVGYSNCYWHGERYYRQRGSRWEVSISMRGPWSRTEAASLPGGLTAQASGGKKNSSKGKSQKH